MRDARAQQALVSFGAALRAERERQGMSQTALSEASGVHRTHLSRIEAGLCEPGWNTLMKLRGGLGSLAPVFEHLEAEAGEQDA
jgi:transcriptional regulator with XRE-family HTH domain